MLDPIIWRWQGGAAAPPQFQFAFVEDGGIERVQKLAR